MKKVYEENDTGDPYGVKLEDVKIGVNGNDGNIVLFVKDSFGEIDKFVNITEDALLIFAEFFDQRKNNGETLEIDDTFGTIKWIPKF